MQKNVIRCDGARRCPTTRCNIVAQRPCLLCFFLLLSRVCYATESRQRVTPNDLVCAQRCETTTFQLFTHQSPGAMRTHNYCALPVSGASLSISFCLSAVAVHCIKMPPTESSANLGQCNMHSRSANNSARQRLYWLLMTVQKCECEASVRTRPNTWNYLKLHFTFGAAAVAAEQKKPKQ